MTPCWAQPQPFAPLYGCRFQSTFLGSRAVAGSLVKHGVMDMKDANGHLFTDVLKSNGFDVSASAINLVAMQPSSIRG